MRSKLVLIAVFLSVGIQAQTGFFLENVADSVGITEALWRNGVTFNDFDNDGDPDIYTVGQGSTPDDRSRMYLNNGDGTFTKTNPTKTIDDGSVYTGIAADYDNDGDLDIYVCGNPISNLYRNDGNNHFTDVTASSNITGTVAFSAAWLDYNNDGLIDLLQSTAHTAYALFKNEGGGVFSNTTVDAGLAGFFPNTRGLTVGDYDNDGDPDIFVANTNTANHFFRNDQGVFVEIAASLGIAYPNESSHHAEFADYDNDGDLDIFTGGINSLHLLKNNGAGGFTDVAESAGLLGTTANNGSVFADYDNDGDQDLIGVGLSVSSRQSVFRNNGDGTFTDVTTGSGLNTSSGIISIATADYDNDGRIDFYAATGGIAVDELYHNVYADPGHWLKVKLVATVSNRAAIGAKIEIGAGGNIQIRHLQGGRCYQSQNSLTEHFGTGSETHLDYVKVTWPNGTVQTITNVSADQLLTVTETETNTESAGQNSISLEQNYPNPFNPTTTIRYSIGVRSQVSLIIYNMLGQEVRTLVNGTQAVNQYNVLWDGKNNAGILVSSGIYLYRLKAGNIITSKRMILLK